MEGFQQKDTVSTALQLELFRVTVKETYMLTRSRPVLGTYVKVAGYIDLYYRTEYILDQLTEPVGQPLPKLEPQLEQELKKMSGEQ